MTIGISVRKEEINIMKYIGATDFFVRSPFVIEGMMIGLIGSLLPLGIIYVIYNHMIICDGAVCNVDQGIKFPAGGDDFPDTAPGIHCDGRRDWIYRKYCYGKEALKSVKYSPKKLFVTVID